MHRSTVRYGVLSVFLLGLVLVAGCFSSKFSIISPDKARVDLAFVGNWNSDALTSEGREAGLIIRNIDDKMYYIEWKIKEDKGLVRAVGCISDIKGATFAQLRGLEEDGKIDSEWLIIRLDRTGNTLKIRHLDDEFMKSQKISSNDQLRKVLEDQLNNEAMYAKDEVMTATRVVDKP
jgi:hypothetical protein